MLSIKKSDETRCRFQNPAILLCVKFTNAGINLKEADIFGAGRYG
jgi:hypothetical protein